MRTRLSGGVAGERRDHPAAPYADVGARTSDVTSRPYPGRDPVLRVRESRYHRRQ